MENKLIENIWIDTNIFDNCNAFLISKSSKIDGLDGAYRIWEEANNTIESSKGNEEKLNQGFLSLKRAFNVASSELRKNLGIDKIKYNSKKRKDFLSDLEYFEITKTLTINKYLKIRNLIEHENYSPPSKEECLYLSEYIWSYIRNTVNILDYFVDEVLFYDDDNSKDKICFEYIVENIKKEYIPRLIVTVFSNPKYISLNSKKNSIKISNIELLNKERLEKLENFKDKIYLLENLHYISFKGEILDQDAISKYLKYLILKEYGGINEESIKSVFTKI